MGCLGQQRSRLVLIGMSIADQAEKCNRGQPGGVAAKNVHDVLYTERRNLYNGKYRTMT